MKITTRSLIVLIVIGLLALGAVGVASAGALSAKALLFQEQDEVEVFGAVEQVTPNFITVQGKDIRLTPQTEFKDSIEVGALVKVHAILADDGSLTAREIELSLPAVVDDNSNDNQGTDDNSNTNTNQNDNGIDDDNSNLNSNDNDEDNSNMNGNDNR